jgi:hypothetical protein
MFTASTASRGGVGTTTTRTTGGGARRSLHRGRLVVDATRARGGADAAFTCARRTGREPRRRGASSVVVVSASASASASASSSYTRSFESELAPLRAAGIEVHNLGDRRLCEGDCAPAVSALQAMLIRESMLELPTGLPTGFFGPSTTEAVKKWQRARGVEPTGVFGDASREAYLAQKKSKLFASIFSPSPPNSSQAWKTAQKIGAPLNSRYHPRSAVAAGLSGVEVFVASFVSGVVFTLFAMFAPRVLKRFAQIREENPEMSAFEIVKDVLIVDAIDVLKREFSEFQTKARGRARRLVRRVAEVSDGLLNQRQQSGGGFGFAIRIGRFRIGTWTDDA